MAGDSSNRKIRYEREKHWLVHWQDWVINAHCHTRWPSRYVVRCSSRERRGGRVREREGNIYHPDDISGTIHSDNTVSACMLVISPKGLVVYDVQIYDGNMQNEPFNLGPSRMKRWSPVEWRGGRDLCWSL